MTRVLFFAVLAGAIAVPASAQAPAGPCKSVFDAVLKMTATPHHAVTSMNGTTRAESIATDDAMYVKLKGAWMKSPVPLKNTLALQQENIRNTTVASCTPLPDELVDGKPAVGYQAHYEQKDTGATDAKVWLSKANGMLLRTDVSLQAGQKTSEVTTFDYDHIVAPVVK
ncbi:MAG TPA: hypothetical protein VHD57_05700 [Vicinamibacterales bacterium]|jgi:hypothetical protein|nr:hypothetical protein [Vicinamibacterales bacterium]